MEQQEGLHLTVLSPEGVRFDGQADIVTLPGAKGSFSVLPRHAPLVSTLVQGEVRYRTGGEEHTLAVAGGFVEVRGNCVSVCAENG